MVSPNQVRRGMSDCGAVEARCRCVLPPGHETPHVCACGGSYAHDADGRLERVYAFPPPYEGGLRLTQEQAIAKANEYVQGGPATTLDALDHCMEALEVLEPRTSQSGDEA